MLVPCAAVLRSNSRPTGSSAFQNSVTLLGSVGAKNLRPQSKEHGLLFPCNFSFIACGNPNGLASSLVKTAMLAINPQTRLSTRVLCANFHGDSSTRYPAWPLERRVVDGVGRKRQLAVYPLTATAWSQPWGRVVADHDRFSLTVVGDSGLTIKICHPNHPGTFLIQGTVENVGKNFAKKRSWCFSCNADDRRSLTSGKSLDATMIWPFRWPINMVRPST